MATTTDATLAAIVEEENPTPMTNKEPPKKAKETMATATEVPLVMPLEDERLAQMAEEAPKKVEAIDTEEEVPNKVIAGSQEKKDLGLDGKGRAIWSQEAKNNEVEGDEGADEGKKMEEAKEGAKGESSAAIEEPTLQDTEAIVFVVEPTPTPSLESNDAEDTRGATKVIDHGNKIDDDDIIEDVIDVDNDKVEGDEGEYDGEEPKVVEEDDEARTLDVEEAMKDDGGWEPMAQDVEAIVPMVELALAVVNTSESIELGEEAAAMTSHDALEGEDKSELWKEHEKKVVATVETKVADKMADDVRVVVNEAEKPEPEGEKDDDVGYGGGNAGELGVEKEVEVYNIVVEAAILGDEVAHFAEASGELGYKKEASGDILIVGGEEAPEESTKKYVDIEAEVAKPELAREVVYGGSVEEVYLASAHGVLENSHGKEQNAKCQTNVSEVVEKVCVEKPLEVENVVVTVQDIGFEKPTKTENVAIEVEDIDVENPTEVKNVVTSSVDDILSQELVLESSNENNNVEETECATEVFNHEEKINDDGIINVMTNVIDVENDEVKGDKGADEGREVEEAEEGAKGESLGAVKEPTLQDTGATIFVMELMPTPLLEPNDVEDTGVATGVVDHENGVDDDDIVENVTNMVDIDNDKVDGDGGGDDDGELEEAKRDAKARTLDAEEAMKDDGGWEPMAQDVEAIVPMVELAPTVVNTSESIKLGEEAVAMASHDALEGEDKSESWKEHEKKVVATVETKVTDKMADDVKVVVNEEENPELEGEKGEDVGYGGGNAGELGVKREVEVSNIIVEAAKLVDEVAYFVEASGELGYEKEASGDILIVGGEEAPEESTKKYVDIKDEVVYGGSVEEVYLASAHGVLENSHGNEQNAECQTNVSEVVENVGVEKSLEVENVVVTVQDIGFEKPTKSENVAIEVEGIDVENPMEVKNVVTSSVDDILSQELILKSSNENNNIEETEGATEVVNHEKINDDGMINIMTNVIDVQNDEVKGDKGADEGGEVEEAEEGAKGESLGAVEEPALQNTGATIFVMELTPTLLLESNDVEDTRVAIGVVDHENKVDDDDIVENVTNMVDIDNDKINSDGGGDDGGELEEAKWDAKVRTLDVEEAMKDDGDRDSIARNVEGATSMVVPMPAVEYKLGHTELGEQDAAIASHDALKGEDKGELWMEQEEKLVGTIEAKVVDKMTDDAKVATTEKEKPEPEVEKGEEVGYGGRDGGELGEKKDVEASAISVEAALFAETSGELGYEKKTSSDILIVGGKEALEESTKKDLHAKYEVAKPELASEVVHGGSVEQFYPVSAHSVLENSSEKEQNAEGQINASGVVKEVGVEKPLNVENVAAMVEKIGFKKPTNIEIVTIEVDGTDVENPKEVENVIASSVDGILSRELAPESSKENNNIEETEGATEIVNHEEEIDDDNIIDDMSNVIDAENDEAEGDGGGDDGEVLEDDAKGGSLGLVEAVKDDGGMELVEQYIEGVISVVESALAQTLEPKSENSELGDEDVMASLDAQDGSEKGELKREGEEEVDAMVEANVAYKVIDDAKTIVDKEEKQELESEKGKVLDCRGGNDGKLGEDKEVNVSAISDKVALFAKVYGELVYEKEASSDIMVVGGEEAHKESIKKYVYIEDVATKASTVVVHDGNINEVDPANQEGVLEDSPKKDQNVEGQANTSKAMEDVRVEKPLYVEVATTIENIGLKNLIEIENVAIVVEDVDVKKPMEVENVVASNVGGIVSLELAAESSKENNDVEKTENDTEVVDHKEEVLNDNIIETMTDAENDEVEGDGEGDDGGVLEEAKEDAKDESFEEKSIKDVGGMEPIVQDKELDISMVELVPVLVVESKLEHSEFGEEEDAMASPDAIEDEDKDELEEEEKVDVMVEAKVMNKVADDEKSAVAQEKLEPEGEKDKEVGHGGVDGGELGKKKEAEVSAINVDTAKQVDKVVPFVEGNDELDYDKKISDDIVAMGGKEVVKELIEKDVDVEDRIVKPKPVREPNTMVVHDGSVEVADSTSVDRVLKNSTEQNAEGQEIASEVLEEVSVQMILEVDNIAIRVEDIGMEKPTKVQNIIVKVEAVDVKKSMEEENIAPSCVDDIVSRVLAPKSNMEKNYAEKTEGAFEVTDHEEETDDDSIIEALKNVIDTENDKAECDTGGDYYREVQDVEGGTKDRSLVAAEDVKDNDEKKLIIQDVEVAISIVEPDLALVAESHSENSELGEEDATMASLDVLEGDDKSEFWEEHEEEEVSDVVEVKTVYKVEDDAKVAAVEQEKPKPEGGKGDEVGYGGRDRDKLSKEKKAKVSIEAAGPGNKIALLCKDKGVLGYKREGSDYTVVVGGEEASEESIGKDVAIEDEAPKPKPASDESIEVVHDGSILKVDLTSADSVLEDSPNKEQNAEGMTTASEVMEDVGVKKVLGDENIVVPVEGIDVENLVKVENVVVSSVDGISFQDFAPESSIENNDAREMEVATEVIDHEDEINDDIRIKAVTDNENGVGNEAGDGVKSNTSGSSYRNTTFCSQGDSRMLIMDRPTALGSSSSSLLPTPPHQIAQSKILNTSELGLTDDQIEETNEEDKKLHDMVELIMVKFLRLVYRLGATLEETIAAKVMYRLSLAEGIIHGWQTNQAFNFDNAQKKALILEEEGKEDLNFSCNILVLGKIGVGKSATINSIFGEEKLKTDAFSSTTTSVQEIVGDVHGVKIRIIDTPGLLPNVMDQTSNRKILVAVKKYTKKCPPDIVLYVDRLDCLSRDLNDLPLLKSIIDTLGLSIWFNAIVVLTHAASPPEGLNGTPMPYEVLMAQSSHIIQQSIRQATRDMSLMNLVALVENHPSCRQNNESKKVLPNDQSWRSQMLLLCYSAKILSDANSLLMLQDPNPKKLFGSHFHSLPLHFLLSSLLQSRGNITVENDQDPPPKNVSIPLPDMALPPSFDCDNPTYRYRFLETTSTVLARPILDAHGWDHDYGYDGISMEDTLAILNRFPGNVEVQVTKNKKEFSIHLDSSIVAQHGENASSLAGFDIHTIGQRLAYILHGDTKIKNIKKNKTTGGFSVTFLGDVVATGLKVEDQLSLGKRFSLVASTGAMRAQGDTAYGANLEARLKAKDYPIGQSLSTLSLSLMKWCQDLALGTNLQSQFSIGRGSKMALGLGLNNKLSGKITVKTSTSEQVQIALLGLVPVATSIYKSFRPSEP